MRSTVRAVLAAVPHLPKLVEDDDDLAPHDELVRASLPAPRCPGGRREVLQLTVHAAPATVITIGAA